MTWLKRNADGDISYAEVFLSDGYTDYTHTALENDTPDGYGPDGRSNKGVPGGSTTVTKNQQPLAQHPSTDFNDPMQPSSDPERSYWDDSHSTAPEGDRKGVQFSPIESMRINIHTRAAADSAGWSFNRSAAFGEFIDNIVPTLEKYRRCGMDRESAAAALDKLYSALFTTTPWASKIASRFLDQVYGTIKQAKPEAAVVAENMEAMVREAHARGLSREAAEDKVHDEFSAWLDNSPGTNLYLRTCLDRYFGIRLGAAGRIEKGQKIKLLANPNVEGVVLSVDETAAANTIQVVWLNATASQPDVATVDIGEVAIVGKASPAEVEAARQISARGSLVIYKSAGTYYLNLLIQHNPMLPISYGSFRKWCASEGVVGNLFIELEKAAVRMNLLEIPDGTVLQAATDVVYMNPSDTSKPPTVIKVEDPTKAPKKITTDEGTELGKAEVKQ